MRLLRLATLSCVLLASGSAFAAVTISGSMAINETQANGTTPTPVGNKYIVVVDTGTAGFGAATTNSVAAGTSLTVGGFFGGDQILEVDTDALTGRSNINLSNFAQAGYAGKQLALIWFNSITGATSVSAGDQYGFVTDATWTVPAADGTYTYATTGGNYTTNSSPGSASLSIAAAPEPSRALLLVFGMVGLVGRRRRKA